MRGILEEKSRPLVEVWNVLQLFCPQCGSMKRFTTILSTVWKYETFYNYSAHSVEVWNVLQLFCPQCGSLKRFTTILPTVCKFETFYTHLSKVWKDETFLQLIRPKWRKIIPFTAIPLEFWCTEVCTVYESFYNHDIWRAKNPISLEIWARIFRQVWVSCDKS